MPAPVSTFEPEPPPGSFLFPDEIIQELTDEERKHGKYTLARLPADKRKSIVQLLIERRPWRDIQRMIEVHWETIKRVADFHAEEIEAGSTQFGRKLRRINWHLADRLEKHSDSFPLQAIPGAIKFIGEFAELIEGRATERVEEVHRVDIFEHWKKYKAAAETMGLEGGKNSVIDAELVPELPAPATAAADPPGNRQGDALSDVSASTPQANGEAMDGLSCGFRPESDPPAAGSDPGPTPPGGGSIAAGPAHPSMGEGSHKILCNEE